MEFSGSHTLLSHPLQHAQDFAVLAARVGGQGIFLANEAEGRGKQAVEFLQCAAEGRAIIVARIQVEDGEKPAAGPEEALGPLELRGRVVASLYRATRSDLEIELPAGLVTAEVPAGAAFLPDQPVAVGLDPARVLTFPAERA